MTQALNNVEPWGDCFNFLDAHYMMQRMQKTSCVLWTKVLSAPTLHPHAIRLARTGMILLPVK